MRAASRALARQLASLGASTSAPGGAGAGAAGGGWRAARAASAHALPEDDKPDADKGDGPHPPDASTLRDRLVLNLYMLRGRAHAAALAVTERLPPAADARDGGGGARPTLAPVPTAADRAETAFFAPVAAMLDAVAASRKRGGDGDAATSPANLGDDATLALWARQLANERRALDAARARYAAAVEKAAKRGDPAAVPSGAELLARLHAGLETAIKAEQRALFEGAPSLDRNQFGPHLLLLDAADLAVITLHTALAHCMTASARKGLPGSARAAVGGAAASKAEAGGGAEAGASPSDVRRLAGAARLTPLTLALGGRVRDQVRLKKLDAAVRGESKRAADLARLYKAARAAAARGPLSDGTEVELLARFAKSSSPGAIQAAARAQLAARREDVGAADPPPGTAEARRAQRWTERAVDIFTGAVHGGDWDPADSAKVAAILLKLLAANSEIEVPLRAADGSPLPPRFRDGRPVRNLRPAFQHVELRARGRAVGVFQAHDEVLRQAAGADAAATGCAPAHLPMLVPPLPWRSHMSGGYLAHRTCVMRTKDRATQRALLAAADKAPPAGLSRVYAALNALGATPWRVHGGVLDAVEAAVAAGGGVCGLPRGDDEAAVPPPRTRFVLTRAASPRRAAFPDAAPAPSALTLATETPAERAERARANTAIKKRNRETHALRCQLDLQLGVAREFRNDAIYFPHFIDFRGRAYPMHPYLNHLGADVCRGLLTFGDAVPLGDGGYDTLLSQIAASYGHGADKLPHDQRIAFGRDRLDAVHAAAEDPWGCGGFGLADEGDDTAPWWTRGEDPWQLLATCIEIRDADASGDPASYASRLPVRMDGSCNGLQHYAALGRDAAGGAAVNLTPAPAPRDVYTAVAALVAARVDADAEAGVPEAVALRGCVDRKLVKQTVMTSVYGVTHVGARGQVAARLRERGWTNAAGVDAFKASAYAARVTLDGLGELFGDAKAIMKWLADAASAVAGTGSVVAWHTPLGLPVAQPYRSIKSRTVQTVLQRVVLDGAAARRDAARAPAQRRRQRAAFPPNFIHALDSTHMMLTAAAAHAEGIAFAGVHDSFWTHAGTAPRLGALLRDAFVDLHARPLLEDLAAELAAAHPSVKLPPLPARGSLDLELVKQSAYFFA